GKTGCPAGRGVRRPRRPAAPVSSHPAIHARQRPGASLPVVPTPAIPAPPQPSRARSTAHRVACTVARSPSGVRSAGSPSVLSSQADPPHWVLLAGVDDADVLQDLRRSFGPPSLVP